MPAWHLNHSCIHRYLNFNLDCNSIPATLYSHQKLHTDKKKSGETFVLEIGPNEEMNWNYYTISMSYWMKCFLIILWNGMKWKRNVFYPLERTKLIVCYNKKKTKLLCFLCSMEWVMCFVMKQYVLSQSKDNSQIHCIERSKWKLNWIATAFEEMVKSKELLNPEHLCSGEQSLRKSSKIDFCPLCLAFNCLALE